MLTFQFAKNLSVYLLMLYIKLEDVGVAGELFDLAWRDPIEVFADPNDFFSELFSSISISLVCSVSIEIAYIFNKDTLKCCFG